MMKTPAILIRESDGLRFEPCCHPGMVRCECCMQLVEPSLIREHRCLMLLLNEVHPGMSWEEGLAAFNAVVKASGR